MSVLLILISICAALSGSFGLAVVFGILGWFLTKSGR